MKVSGVGLIWDSEVLLSTIVQKHRQTEQCRAGIDNNREQPGSNHVHRREAGRVMNGGTEQANQAVISQGRQSKNRNEGRMI